MTDINKIIAVNIFVAICASNCNIGIANNAGSKYVKASISPSSYEFSITGGINESQERMIKKEQIKAKSAELRLAGSLAFGYYLTDNSRVELMGSFSPNSNVAANHSSDSSKISLKSYSLFGNYYYDFANKGSNFTPYAKFGAGFVSNHASVTPSNGSKINLKKSGFSGTIGAGFVYAISQNVVVDVGYAMQYRFSDGAVHHQDVQEKTIANAANQQKFGITSPSITINGKTYTQEEFNKMYPENVKAAPTIKQKSIIDSDFSRLSHSISLGIGLRF